MKPWPSQVHAGPGASRTLGFLPTGRAWGAPLDAKMATLYYSMRLDDPRVAACWVPLVRVRVRVRVGVRVRVRVRVRSALFYIARGGRRAEPACVMAHGLRAIAHDVRFLHPGQVPPTDGGTACGGNALPDSFDVAAFREEC